MSEKGNVLEQCMTSNFSHQKAELFFSFNNVTTLETHSLPMVLFLLLSYLDQMLTSIRLLVLSTYS